MYGAYLTKFYQAGLKVFNPEKIKWKGSDELISQQKKVSTTIRPLLYILNVNNQTVFSPSSCSITYFME